jgi:hypothetical protein
MKRRHDSHSVLKWSPTEAPPILSLEGKGALGSIASPILDIVRFVQDDTVP